MKSIGKFIAYALRHNPTAAGISLDEHGWADTGALIDSVNKNGGKLDFEGLRVLVANDGKMRFSFNADFTKIRANQGHSVAVDVQMPELQPPDELFHGTAERFLGGIEKDGICRKTRNYVHLSKNFETAVRVGARHGSVAVLTVDSAKMYADGYRFYLSVNGVWQTEHVPYCYVKGVRRDDVE